MKLIFQFELSTFYNNAPIVLYGQSTGPGLKGFVLCLLYYNGDTAHKYNMCEVNEKRISTHTHADSKTVYPTCQR